MLWAWLFACADTEPPISREPVSQDEAAVEQYDPCNGAPAGDGPPVILLVSMDTARADAFGVYGNETASTPYVDALAECGVRFDQALSHVPTTLNSHTTMLSGLDPHAHGVVRNGYQLSPSFPLLQEQLSAAGWDTIAVVGAMALQSEMGLSRGFDVYDDTMPVVRDSETGQESTLPEDRANGVNHRVLAAVDARQDPTRPLFLFVHYYDPHLPWNSAPAEIRARFIDLDYTGPVSWKPELIPQLQGAAFQGLLAEHPSQPGQNPHLRQAWQLYLAELHWTDHQLGALLSALDSRGLGANRLTVVTSDHGETIGDWEPKSIQMSNGETWLQNPIGHGDDVSNVNLRVPLIWSGQGRFDLPNGQVIEDLVGLVDVAPTLLSLAQPGTTIGEGRDLAGFWTGQAPHAKPHFAEATKPVAVERLDAWNNLDFDRRVTHQGAIYRDTPWIPHGPVITNMQEESTQISDDLRHELADLLSDWDDRAPAWRPKEMSQETEEGLRALGYLE